MIYRINAGHIPKDNWLQDPKIGGGRIIGEACHFIDLLVYLNGSKPISVNAQAVGNNSTSDNVNISLVFENGSIGTINYVSNGGKSLPKEYIEVHSQGNSLIINDFKQLQIFGDRRSKNIKRVIQNKGQKEMLDAYFKSLSSGQSNLISIDEINTVTKTTFLVIESLRDNGQTLKI